MKSPRLLVPRLRAVLVPAGVWACCVAWPRLAGHAGRSKPEPIAGNRPAQAGGQQPIAATTSRGAVYTLDADRFDGPILSLADGQLAIDSDPPRTVPLDQVDRIDLGAAPVGIAGLGRARQPRRRAGRQHGRRQRHSGHPPAIRGISRGHGKITQVVVSGVLAGGVQVWMLDPGNTPVLATGIGRTRPTAPRPTLSGAAGGRLFRAAARRDADVRRQDDVKSRITPTTHTDNGLKVGKVEGEAKPAAVAVEPLVVLATDETVHGRSVEIGEDLLRLKLLTGPELKIPLAEVRGIWLGDDKSEHRKTFDEKLKNAGGDRLGPDREQRETKRKPPRSKEACRPLPTASWCFWWETTRARSRSPRVLGLVMAAHPAPPQRRSSFIKCSSWPAATRSRAS